MVEQVAPEGKWGIAPFYIERGSQPQKTGTPFDFGAPTTARNAMRVLRALQLPKAVLLEGSPGVGKTSLVAALAHAVGEFGLLSLRHVPCIHSVQNEWFESTISEAQQSVAKRLYYHSYLFH